MKKVQRRKSSIRGCSASPWHKNWADQFMRKHKTAPIIKQRYDKIGKNLEKLLGSFTAEGLHDFRVEFKKLRAFLRLVASERTKAGRHLHRFYQLAGFIRSLQLQQQRIGEAWMDKEHLPKSYLDLLDAEISAKIDMAQRYAKKNLSVKKEIQKTLARTSHYLSKTSSTGFTRSAATRLEHLSGARPLSEDLMHEIRKRLKDLSYNRSYIEKEAALILPASLTDKHRLSQVLETLGKFQDLRSGLALLQPNYLDRVTDPQERAGMEAIKIKWEEKKYRLYNDLADLLVQSVHPYDQE
jgi:CHAD domain-containing protein